MSARARWLWRPRSFIIIIFFIFSVLIRLEDVSPSSSSAFSLSSASFLPISTPAMPPAQILLMNLILLTNHANMPSSSTIFLPLNQSIGIAFPSSYAHDRVAYHIANARHAYRDLLLLQRFPLELPTLLHGRSIRVSRSDQSLVVDEQEIVAPDLYSDDYVVVHGITLALDPNFYMSQSSGAAAKVFPIPGGLFFELP